MPDQKSEFDLSAAIAEAKLAVIEGAQVTRYCNANPALDILVFAPSFRVRIVQQVISEMVGGRVVRRFPKAKEQSTTTIEIEANFSIVSGSRNIEVVLNEIQSSRSEDTTRAIS